MQNKYELAQRVIEHFIKEGKTLSTAESCTGGGIGQALTSVSGSSAAYGYGIISYSNEAKESVLNVPHAVLEQYGAVSQETADAMCRGAKALSGADVAVAVTGIAGPGGGSDEKPVGLIYIGLRYNGKTICKEVRTRDVNRKWNRSYALLSMLDLINRNV